MRSKLFVPSSKPELFPKAEAGAADALSFDLEDSVSESRKAEARRTLAEYLTNRPSNGKEIVVRINGRNTPYFDGDVEAVVSAGATILNLPMVNSIDDLDALEKRITAFERRPGLVSILVNVETPAGLRAAPQLAAHPRVMGLQIGYADLLEPHGLDRRDENVLSHIRLTVCLAAAEFNKPVYDGAFADLGDMEFFRTECMAGRRQGLSGKSCIHPSQVPVVNDIFRPTEREVARARKIIAAAARAKDSGVFVVDGQMIDKPFLERAQAIVSLAERYSL